ncbi:endonuclease/exonuclease/phosphatase family protein [Mycobacterium sp. NPDC050853]|uniref:endonuclease/exonuclease/phosphatase family protein n=1 Tax=Mycobacterium sp. NPDC050853 TaxID=3155160 RepID=UPI00340AA092
MVRTTFSVATFNMYNLQDAKAKLYATTKPWTPEEFKRKTEWAAWQLGTVGADVIGMQEVWSKSALEAVLAVDPKGLADEYDVLATPAVGTSITCAALVRKGLLIGKPKWINDFPKAVRLESRDDPADPQAPVIDVSITSFSRPVLNFQVQLRDDEPATEVFVVHLKSKLPTQISRESWYKNSSATYRPHQQALGDGISTIRRTAEAVAVRILLNGVMRDTETPVIVLGDMNDGKESNTANILTAQPRYLVGDSQGGSDFGLYSAQTLQEYRDTRDVYYTHVHQDLRESLDHVLVSEQFYDHSRKRVWLFDGLLINNDHLNFENHRETGTGDHGIVRVSFKHDPAK